MSSRLTLETVSLASSVNEFGARAHGPKSSLSRKLWVRTPFRPKPGVDGAVIRARVGLKGTRFGETDRQYSAGVNFGWRFDLPADFYATAWLGLGSAFGAEDVVLDGQRFEPTPLSVFPAIHLGYHLR